MSIPMTMKHLVELPHINTFTHAMFVYIQFWAIFCCLSEIMFSCFRFSPAFFLLLLRVLLFVCSFSFREVFFVVGRCVVCSCGYDMNFVLIFVGIVFAHKYHRIATDEIEYGEQQAVFFPLFIWFIGFTVFVRLLLSSVACVPTECYLLAVILIYVYGVYWTYTTHKFLSDLH